VIDFLVKVLINAVAVWAAIQLIPQISLGGGFLNLAIVALIFAIVNAYIRPIVKALSFPITLISLGLVSFVINAALFLLVAWLASQVKIPFEVADFPPKLSAEAIVAALLGSIVVSVVSTLLGLVDFGRRLVLR
jgi:putative membrane protein